MTAAHGFKPAFGHTEPRRGTEWWGKSLLVTFGLFPKVTRCKSGTHSGRYPATDMYSVKPNDMVGPKAATEASSLATDH